MAFFFSVPVMAMAGPPAGPMPSLCVAGAASTLSVFAGLSVVILAAIFLLGPKPQCRWRATSAAIPNLVVPQQVTTITAGLEPGLRPHAVHIPTSAIAPGTSRSISVRQRGASMLEAGGLLLACTVAGKALLGRVQPKKAPLRVAETAIGEPAVPALLLDCDGTIVDTERDGHRVSFNQAFAQKGLSKVEWDVELYGKLLATGGGKERMTRYFKEYAPELWPDRTQPPAPKHPLIADLHQLKTQLFMSIVESGSLPLRPGIKALVDEALGAGWKVAVCSTSNEKAVQAVVDTLLESKIKHIFAGDVVAQKKPHPAIYVLAARELGLNPVRCVVVEDSEIGLQAARAAGMKCIVTRSTYTAEEDFTGAELVLDDLGGTHLAQVEALI
eukprot:GGOE01058465.1.p1 GENE.GGOE01058465.1~~GGOE01058465.1.p1  ORF type:complete len:386 (-),score=67.95 GGOE01058465.1:425-1582(-)